MRSRKEELRKRRERNAERRKRFARADETICAEHHSNLFSNPENGGSAGSWKTIAAFRNVSWGKLSRGLSRPQQGRIHLKVWRFAPRAGRDRLLARNASRRTDRLARKTRSAPA